MKRNAYIPRPTEAVDAAASELGMHNGYKARQESLIELGAQVKAA